MDDTFDFFLNQTDHPPLLELPFTPEALIKQCVDLLNVSANEKSLILTYEVDDTIPKSLIGDPKRIGQILIELVNNALKFTDEGSVHIDMFVFYKSTQSYTIECAVIATGIVDYSTDTTTAGLPMCKQLLETMGSSLEIESEPAHGTTFSFRLNLGIAHSIPLMQTTLPTYFYHFSNIQLLLVDDNDDNRETAGTLLKKIGANVDEACNGNIAIDMIRIKHYDIVLMDIQMPKLDGISATKLLRSEGFTDLLIIALSAHTSAIQRQASLDAGMNDHLSKPYTLNSLQTLLLHWFPDKIDQKIKVSNAAKSSWVSELPVIPGLVLSDEMSDYWLGKEDFLHKLKQFIHNTMDECNRVHLMVDVKNISTALKALHKIKGSVKLYGANRLYKIIEQLETLLNEDKDANVSDLLHQFDAAIVELTTYLEYKEH